MLRGSNPRPSPCKGDALPTELSIHKSIISITLFKYNTFIIASQHFFDFFIYIFLIFLSSHFYKTLHQADQMH